MSDRTKNILEWIRMYFNSSNTCITYKIFCWNSNSCTKGIYVSNITTRRETNTK